MRFSGAPVIRIVDNFLFFKQSKVTDGTPIVLCAVLSVLSKKITFYPIPPFSPPRFHLFSFDEQTGISY